QDYKMAHSTLLQIKQKLIAKKDTEIISLASISQRATGLTNSDFSHYNKLDQPISMLKFLGICPYTGSSDSQWDDSDLDHDDNAEPPLKRLCQPGCIQLPNLVIAPVEPECSLPNLLYWPRYYFDKDLSLQAPSGGLSQAKTRPEEQPSTSFLRSEGPSFKSRSAGPSPSKLRSDRLSPSKPRSAGASPSKPQSTGLCQLNSQTGELLSARPDHRNAENMWGALQDDSRVIYAADMDESDGPSFFARVARESGAVMLRCQNQEVDDGVIRQEESEDDGDHLDTDEELSQDTVK
ncbi:hypothetical protein BOX15_Mlig004128g1, partial [Macrostomum lignano]